MKTIDQYITELKEKKEAFKMDNRPLFIASSDTADRMSQRIFQRGENRAGKTHQYGGGPIYMTYKKSRILKGTPPKGKPGASRNVPDRKSVYFESYKAYRASVGLPTTQVTFENNGDLRSDFENLTAAGGIPTPKKISNNHYRISISRSANVDKSEHLEERYGKVFEISAAEKKKFLEVLEFEFGRNV